MPDHLYGEESRHLAADAQRRAMLPAHGERPDVAAQDPIVAGRNPIAVKDQVEYATQSILDFGFWILDWPSAHSAFRRHLNFRNPKSKIAARRSRISRQENPKSAAWLHAA